MKRISLSVTFILCVLSAYPQNIIKYYGPDTTYSYYPTDVIELSTGGYLITGFVYWAAPLIENTYHHRYYVATNVNGDTVWTRYFPQNTLGYATLLEQINGDILAFGNNGGSGACGGIFTTWPYSDYYLETLSTGGNQNSYNQISEDCNDDIVDIVKHASGGFTAFMRFGGSPVIGARDSFKIKEVNAAGTIVSSVLAPDSIPNPFEIEKANYGYWVAGYNRLDRVSPAGNLLWSKPMVFSPYLSDFCKGANDSLVFACSSWDGAYPDTCTIVKSDSTGNVSWVKHYHLRAAHIFYHSSGNYIVTGKYNGDVAVLALNSNGDSLWFNKFTLISGGVGIKSIENGAGDIVTLASSGGWGESGKYVLILQNGVILSPFPPTNLHSNPVLKMPQGSKVQLDWTDNSTDEDGFIIQHNDGTGWVTADSVAANTADYLDEDLIPGTAYSFRVAAFNSYGLSAFANTSSTTTFTSIADLVASNITLFPNPNNGVFTVTADASVVNGLSLELLNAMGNTLVVKKARTGQSQFDLTAYGKGIFFLKLKIQNELVDIRKIVSY